MWWTAKRPCHWSWTLSWNRCDTIVMLLVRVRVAVPHWWRPMTMQTRPRHFGPDCSSRYSKFTPCYPAWQKAIKHAQLRWGGLQSSDCGKCKWVWRWHGGLDRKCTARRESAFACLFAHSTVHWHVLMTQRIFKPTTYALWFYAWFELLRSAQWSSTSV